MRIIEISDRDLSALIEQIRNDVLLLKKEIGNTDRIKIAIPFFIKEIIIEYFRTLTFYPADFEDSYFGFYGVKIVPGYNNQICVFDEQAMPHHKFLEPIQIKFNDK